MVIYVTEWKKKRTSSNRPQDTFQTQLNKIKNKMHALNNIMWTTFKKIGLKLWFNHISPVHTHHIFRMDLNIFHGFNAPICTFQQWNKHKFKFGLATHDKDLGWFHVTMRVDFKSNRNQFQTDSSTLWLNFMISSFQSVFFFSIPQQ